MKRGRQLSTTEPTVFKFFSNFSKTEVSFSKFISFLPKTDPTFFPSFQKLSQKLDQVFQLSVSSFDETRRGSLSGVFVYSQPHR